MLSMRGGVVATLICLLLGTFSQSSFAITIKDFRKYSHDDQSQFIVGAVSMAAYSFAANGAPERGRCIMNWFFGKAGQETPGPNKIAFEIGIAERRDAAAFHVEGVILGLAEKACPAVAAATVK